MRTSNAARNEAVALKAQARREREQREATRAKELAEREAKLQKALAEKPKTLVDRHFNHFPSLLVEKYTPFREILEVLDKKAPRLAETTMLNAFQQIARLPFLRAPRDWKPKGKGRETLFRGLCEHLLAKYPMPQFLWSAFSDGDAATHGPFVAFVAGGGSVYEAVKKGLLNVPFTRKMCHDFMATPSDVTFLRALRRTPVFAFGGSERFLNVWMTSQAGRVLHAKETEAFWMVVLEWFGKHPMLNPDQVGPLVDYILVRRREDPDFSMKGRSPLAMIRGMEEWHTNLAREKAIHGATYALSGFRDFETTKGTRDSSGNYITETWKVKEILTSKALAEEGRKLGHCVYSYSWSVEKGQVSIWSMTCESSLSASPERAVTIELRNANRKIVQVRGKFNRRATAREFQVLKDWAGLNNLEIGSYL